MVYCDFDQQFGALPMPEIRIEEMIDELYDAVMRSRAPVHGSESALATMEVCLAILQSSREQKEILLIHQTGLPELSKS
jgi:phthalate 4,5-cis-dihydrodiol dehydrogenase